MNKKCAVKIPIKTLELIRDISEIDEISMDEVLINCVNVYYALKQTANKHKTSQINFTCNSIQTIQI